MYILIFAFFLAEELVNEQKKRRIRKTKEDIFKKVTGSIMMEEIANEDFQKTSSSIKSPDKEVDDINYMEKNIRSKKSDILWLAYQQGQIFEKFKVNESFIDMIKKLGY